MTHWSALQVGQCTLTHSEGCGLAGVKMFLPVPLSQALQCSVWWARLGKCCQCSLPAKPVLTLHSETFLWEKPDLVEWCLCRSLEQRPMRRTLKTMVQVLCSTWSLLDNAQIFVEAISLIFFSLSSAWTVIHEGMAGCDVDCFLHAADLCY